MADQASNAAPNKNKKSNGKGGNLGFEADLFKAADKLRGNMEPSDYKHVALGLIFLKHISDSFEAKRAELLAQRETIAKLRDGGSNKILINLSAVSFMDSSGLGELASAYAGVNKAGGQLKLVNIPARILDLLRITKLDTILTGFSSEPAALQSFSSGVAGV